MEKDSCIRKENSEFPMSEILVILSFLALLTQAIYFFGVLYFTIAFPARLYVLRCFYNPIGSVETSGANVLNLKC